MPIRSVKPRSDRGSIKNLSYVSDEYNSDPTSEELELKQKYEYAQNTRDKALEDSLGFVVMSGPGDRASLPIAIHRHREYIDSLSRERYAQIERTRQELAGCFPAPFKQLTAGERLSQYKKISSQVAICKEDVIIKMAGVHISVPVKRSFRRSK